MGQRIMYSLHLFQLTDWISSAYTYCILYVFSMLQHIVPASATWCKPIYKYYFIHISTYLPALGAIAESLNVASGAPQRVSDGKSVSPVVQSTSPVHRSSRWCVQSVVLLQQSNDGWSLWCALKHTVAVFMVFMAQIWLNRYLYITQ